MVVPRQYRSLWVRHPAKIDSTLTPVLINNLGSSGPEPVYCEFRSVVSEFGNAVFNLDFRFEFGFAVLNLDLSFLICRLAFRFIVFEFGFIVLNLDPSFLI